MKLSEIKTVVMKNGTLALANDKGRAKAYMTEAQAEKAADKLIEAGILAYPIGWPGSKHVCFVAIDTDTISK